MSTPASPEQMRMVHAIARDAAEERHEHIRDRAATMFGVTSPNELDMNQMRALIDVYAKMLKPEPAPPVLVMGRGAFGGLPKRVTPTPPVEAPKPVVRVSVSPKVLPPAPPKPRTVHNFDPGLKIARGGGLEEIPF
jgi:hypothetical protein